jgi:threonine dehydratase
MSSFPPSSSTYDASVNALKLLRDRAGANVTPLLRSAALDARVGGRVFVKAESLQLTGSFKYRGAYTKLHALSTQRGITHVVTFSSGNHGQAVACAAKMLDMAATVVMPTDAPATKIAATRAHGADVVLYDRATDDRAAIANDIAARTGAVFVHPFDDVDVMAGQGTAALEFLTQLEMDWGVDAGVLDHVLVCCSGGGLSSGIAGVLEVRGNVYSLVHG